MFLTAVVVQIRVGRVIEDIDNAYIVSISIQVEDFSFLDEDFFTAVNNSPSESGQTTPTNRAESKERDVLSQQDLLNRSCHDLMLPNSIQVSNVQLLYSVISHSNNTRHSRGCRDNVTNCHIREEEGLNQQKKRVINYLKGPLPCLTSPSMLCCAEICRHISQFIANPTCDPNVYWTLEHFELLILYINTFYPF